MLNISTFSGFVFSESLTKYRLSKSYVYHIFNNGIIKYMIICRVSKLAAGRDKDLADIATPKVLKALNWAQLEESANLVEQGMLSGRAKQEFEISYREFVRWHRP